jgi:hypothetical protein
VRFGSGVVRSLPTASFILKRTYRIYSSNICAETEKNTPCATNLSLFVQRNTCTTAENKTTALFGILGIVSNVSVPLVLGSIGLRSFSLLATFSSLLFPLATLLTDSYRSVVAAGCVGLLGSAQKLGTSAAMASLATEFGVPQGKMQGEKASMLALLKIGCPIIYGMLYLRGKVWGAGGVDAMDGVGGHGKVWSDVVMGRIGKKLPFVLNVVLGVCALAITWKNM